MLLKEILMSETWQKIDNTLVKTFQFSGFSEAVDFVNKVADLANKEDHHPDIEIFSYKFVKIKLTTHCEGSKVTAKDYKLKELIDQL